MQKSLKDYPKRGDIFIADLDPSLGREIRKKRPVLVISNNNLNETLPTVVIIPFSSIIPSFVGPDVAICTPSKTGLDKQSALLTSQMRSIDKDRFVKKIGKLTEDKLLEVEGALTIALELKRMN